MLGTRKLQARKDSSAIAKAELAWGGNWDMPLARSNPICKPAVTYLKHVPFRCVLTSLYIFLFILYQHFTNIISIISFQHFLFWSFKYSTPFVDFKLLVKKQAQKNHKELRVTILPLPMVFIHLIYFFAHKLEWSKHTISNYRDSRGLTLAAGMAHSWGGSWTSGMGGQGSYGGPSSFIMRADPPLCRRGAAVTEGLP